ncbi:MAG TPA: ROK family protein [Afifellaceae bacterium]|nr:ROK family protein [Afifellaceae bacterium]
MRPDDVRNRNRQHILATVRRVGTASRTEIGRTTGLSAATVSAITSNLIDEQVLMLPAKGETLATGRGRPKVDLVVNPQAALVGTVIFQLNSVCASVIDYAGRVVAEHATEIDTFAAGKSEIRNALTDCLRRTMRRTRGSSRRLAHIAVGVQGATDVKGTKMLWSPVSKQRNLPIRDWLEDDFGAPTHVANDCDMIALALNWREPERYGRNFAAVLLAHGVGMGLFLRGGLINGTRSSGTEFGHMTYIPDGAACRCGGRGCIEAYAGDYGICRAARGEPEDTSPPGPLEPPDIAAIADRAHGGDTRAVAAIRQAGAAIGTGLANVFALTDPFTVVLVGSGTAAFDLMEPPMRNAMSGKKAGFPADNVAIDCFTDAQPLLREGCAISALLVQDERVAKQRSKAEAVL